MSKRAKVWLISVAIFIVVAVPTAMTLRSWMNSDSTGTVSVGQPKGNAAVAAQPIDVTNNFFAATLPAGFSIRSQQNGSQNPTEEYSVDAATSGGIQMELTISYGTMLDGRLDSVSGYQLRATQTSNYTPYSVPGAPSGSVAFRDLNNPYSSAAYVVFWPRNGSCATIALTGGVGANLSQLNTSFAQLVSSWKWK